MHSVEGPHGGIKIMTLLEAQAHLREAVAADKAAQKRLDAANAEYREAARLAEASAREVGFSEKALMIAALTPDIGLVRSPPK